MMTPSNSSLRHSSRVALGILSMIPCAMAQDAYLQNMYQNATYLSGGIPESDLLGMGPRRAREESDLERFTDHLHFSLSGGVRYDSNIYLTSQNEVDDVIFSVSPSFSYRSGEGGSALNTFFLSYTPSFNVYTSNSDRDTIDHVASFRYGREMPKSQLNFSLNYSKNTGSDRYVSGTVNRDTLRAVLGYNYALTGKTRLDFSANSDIDVFDSGGLSNRAQYGLRTSLLYQITGKSSVGPSFNYGYSSLQDSQDQNSYEIGLKFDYKASGKTSVSGTLGYNVLTFSGSDASSNQSILAWSVAGRYSITGKTSMSASFYRRPQLSYSYSNSGFIATGISFTANHKLSVRTSLFTMLSYENNDYYQTSENAGTTSNNNYYTATLGARHQLDNGFSFGTNMTWRTNSTDETIRQFDNFTIGLNASYNFW